MITQKIDGISFEMKQAHDFSCLSRYGRVFCVFSRNDSGNISFGTDDGKNKYFIKVAGTKTARSIINPEEAIAALKKAIPLYVDLSHPRLIQLKEHFEYGDAYAAVFEWANGDCLFDYWNFDYYNNNPGIIPPRERFHRLSREKKLKAFDAIFDFLTFTEAKGYVAVDCNDNNIMYDFDQDIVTMCDIDFYRKKGLINDMGEDFWQSKRFKAPEEYILGAKIDTVTNVFTLGALLMHFFGSYSDEEISRMYEENAFFPCKFETWELNELLYEKTLKAVSPERSNRYDSMKSFYEEWKAALSSESPPKTVD